MRTRFGALVMAALLLLYLVFAVYYGTVLLSVGEPIATALGVALLVLPVIGFWALVRELIFAFRADRLARRMETEGALPDEQLPLRPSGRVERDAALQAFPKYQRAVEDAPEQWRGWLRLSWAYDASGDRRRARWAARQAIRLSVSDR